MISVEEARRIIMAKVPKLEPDLVRLDAASGMYTAEDIRAPHDHPLFDMSAVDGYALAFDPVISHWSVATTLAAGDAPTHHLMPGTCARIFTGAMLPPGADTVVMQEFVTGTEGRITHADQRLMRGANVRRRAEQVEEGSVILAAGSLLTPAAIGLLASVGVRAVHARPYPDVAVLVTGNEFVHDGKLVPGRIFSSNDRMLEALLRGSVAIEVPDQMEALLQAIEQAAASNEVIITTGGASVGDHDLVHEAVVRSGGTIHFHGVAQKPGKPMLFATVNGRPFFGLPGNPRAVFVLVHAYVLPFLRAMRGAADPFGRVDQLPLKAAVHAKGDRAEFRAARVRGGFVELLQDEGSHMLRSLIDADALAYLPRDRRTWEAGDRVEVRYFSEA